MLGVAIGALTAPAWARVVAGSAIFVAVLALHAGALWPRPRRGHWIYLALAVAALRAVVDVCAGIAGMSDA